MTGIKQGQLYGTVAIGTTIADTYTFNIQVIDSQGSSSSVYQGEFLITPEIEEGPHAPSISGLQLSPFSAAQNQGGGSVTVVGNFNFSDSGGDVSGLLLTTYDSHGNITNSTSSPVSNLTGITQGQLSGSVAIGTTIADTYTFKIQLIDLQGSSSSVFQGTFLVTPETPAPSSQPTVLKSGYSISLVASGLGNAMGVAIGPSGDIFVSDYESTNGKIFKIDRNTFLVTEYESGIGYCPSIAFNSAGRLFALSGQGGSNGILEVFSNHTSSLFSSNYFSYPTSLIGTLDGGLYVTNSGNGTVSKVSEFGVAQTHISGFASGGPYGASLDNVGNLYFIEHMTGKIYWCNTSKSVSSLATLTPYGPAFTAVDNTGTLFVSDSLNATIYTIKNGVVSIFASGFKGKSTAPLMGPGGMSFDSVGNLFVTDGDKLWKITPPG